MFKDKLNKVVGAAKEKASGAMNGGTASGMKEMFSAMGKEAIVGGIQESVKAGLSGKNAGQAFQDHVMGWAVDYQSQKIEELKTNARDAFVENFSESYWGDSETSESEEKTEPNE